MNIQIGKPLSTVHSKMIPDNTGKPVAAISVDIAVYDGYGSETKYAKSVNLKKANPGQFTHATVMRMYVTGARSIRNVKIGIVDSSGTAVTSSGTQNPDRSMTEGNAGISHGQTMSTAIASYFKGVNETGTANDVNNVSVANGVPNGSEFIALNVKVPNEITEGYLAYRWFFDFVD